MPMDPAVTIGVIGDFDPFSGTHRATNDALEHAAGALGTTVDVEWVPTLTLEGASAEATLRRFHGLWCAPGSPYQSMLGALSAIRFAREHGRPFFGT